MATYSVRAGPSGPAGALLRERARPKSQSFTRQLASSSTLDGWGDRGLRAQRARVHAGTGAGAAWRQLGLNLLIPVDNAARVDELGGLKELVEDEALVGVLQQAALPNDRIQVGVWEGGAGKDRRSVGPGGREGVPLNPARALLRPLPVCTAERAGGVISALYFMSPLFYKMSENVKVAPNKAGPGAGRTKEPPPGSGSWYLLRFSTQNESGPRQGLGSRGPTCSPRVRTEGWEPSTASLTHKLKHQVNVPAVLCRDDVEEADDVGMVPKLLWKVISGQGLCPGVDGPVPLFLERTAPGEGKQAGLPGRTWRSMTSRNVLWKRRRCPKGLSVTHTPTAGTQGHSLL